MRHVFILNPTSGSYDRTAEMRGKIEDVMGTQGDAFELYLTERPHHGQELARAAAEQGDPVRIYACGGDGTLNEVANGAAGFANAAITNIPLGSGNDFIRIFGEEKGRFFDLRELLHAEQAAFDLIDCNGRYAINICSLGFDARVGLGMADYRRGPATTGAQAYKKSLAANLLRGINSPLDVTVNGQEFKGKRVLVCICNGRYYGGGFNPSPTARPDDGEFDIFVTERLNLIQVAQAIDLYAKGRAAEVPKLIHVLKGNEVFVHCGREEMVNLDGERMDARDVHVKLADKKVNFFYPQGAWPAR